jgi:2'-5' RNA ligase
MEKIRTFIAIPLSQDLIENLKKIITTFQTLSKGIKWMNPNSIHLTLKFLGNLEMGARERVICSMDDLFNNRYGRFNLMASGLGAFPNIRRPRVFWVGIKGKDVEKLLLLQQDIEDKLAQAGFQKEERRFSPHLTLGRVKYADNMQQLIDKTLAYDFLDTEFPVENVQIMRSDLKPSGAVYSVQKSYALV